MSDDNNVFETLRDKERSSEGSEMGESTADFFEDDGTQQEPTSGLRPDNLGEVDTKVGQSVSYYDGEKFMTMISPHRPSCGSMREALF